MNIKKLMESEMSEQEFDACMSKGLSCKFDNYEKILESILLYRYPLYLMNAIQDDMTAVGIIDMEKRLHSQCEDYYCEPDWQNLQKLWQKKFYPELFQE